MMVWMATAALAASSLAAPSRQPSSPTDRKPAAAAKSRGPAVPLETLFGRAAGERFGASLGLRPEGLLIGANRAVDTAWAQGAVDVFRQRTTVGGIVWDADNVNLHPDGRYLHDTPNMPPQADSYLGWAMDVDGDTAIVGMRGFDITFDDGAVLVLERSGAQWRLVQEITLMDSDGAFIEPRLESDLQNIGLAGDDLTTSGWQFGHDVAIHGDLMAVGAPYAHVPESPGQNPHEEAGLVLIFNRSSGEWRYESLLTRDNTNTSEEPADFDYFGYAVSIFNNLIAIGAPNIEPAGGENNGHVYLFKRSSPSRWNHIETLYPNTAAYWWDCGHFGWSVDIDDTSVVVGQPGSNSISSCPPTLPYHSGQGRAWVYESSDGLDWTHETMLFVEFPPLDHPWADPDIRPSTGAQYGWSVAISPCHVAVGAPGGDSNFATEEGATYLWTHLGLGNWNFMTIDDYFASPIGLPGDQWGHAVSVNDHLLAIGGWRCDNAYLDGGAAEIWQISCDCDRNEVPDNVDITKDPSLDCDDSGFIDSCEIDWDPSLDCGGQEGGAAPGEPDGVLDTCQISSPGSLEWSTAQGGNGHRYDVVEGLVTWTDAAVLANTMGAGADLASLTTWDEATFVAAYLEWDIDSNGELWLGGEQAALATDPTVGWSWRIGDPWSWARWDDGATNQPDTSGAPETALLAIAPTDLDEFVWDWDDEDPDVEAAGWLVEYNRDCDSDGILDECQIGNDISLDCEPDGRIDSCMIDDGIVPDCNDNGFPDSCDIAWGSSEDCIITSGGDGNGIPDECDLADGTSDDCNGNGIPDECDIASGYSLDTNDTGVPDECELLVINEVMINPEDNLNGDTKGIVDFSDQFIEIVNFTEESVDMSGWRIQKSGLNWYWIPNGTTLDSGCVLLIFTYADPLPSYFPAIVLSANQANNPLETPSSGGTRTITLRDSSAIVDDVTYGTEVQAGGASITRCPDLIGIEFVRHNYPDDCDLTDWTNYYSPGRQIDGYVFPGACVVDTDEDGAPGEIDNCDLFNPDQADCNNNGIGDVCDIQNYVDAGGSHEDLDCNWNWQLDECDDSPDCNGNGIPDACEINDGTALDCNSNGLLDQCELDSGDSPDCNVNGIPDECDIDTDFSEDCNDNDVPDECDLLDPDQDTNSNGVLDECECDSPCDLNNDGLCTVSDFLEIIQNFGCPDTVPPPCTGDLNGDGVTDIEDILEYSSTCSQ